MFQTQYNRKSFPDSRNELPVGKSMTIPDQTLSIKQILDRYARGLPLGGAKEPIYEGEEDFTPDLEHMDLADRQEYLENVEKEVSEIKERMDKREKQRAEKKAARAAAEAAQVKALTEPIDNPNTPPKAATE